MPVKDAASDAWGQLDLERSSKDPCLLRQPRDHKGRVKPGKTDPFVGSCGFWVIGLGGGEGDQEDAGLW